jgi:hypothetical protein
VRHPLRVADLHHPEDDVVGVLLEGVVERGGEVGLRAVVIDAQAAADVEVAQRRPHAVEVDVDPARLAQRLLDGADRGDLAAEMEVQELEARQHVLLAQVGDGVEEVLAGEAELRAVAGGGLPVPGALGRQPAADADARLDTGLLGDVADQRQLRGLLDDQDHRPAEARGEQRHLDVLLVLVAVADDQRVGVLEHRHHRQQLRLRAHLEAEVEGLAVLHQVLDDEALLVDLDRIDAAVDALVAVLADGVLEGLVELDDARLEDLGEADQEGKTDPPLAQLVDQAFEVDRRRPGPAGVHDEVAQVVDGEVVVPPAGDVVEVGGVGGGPALGKGFRRGHRRRGTLARRW